MFIGRTGTENGSFGIHTSHSDALSRDLSLSRVPCGHYEERSREPVGISERWGVIPSAGCSNWPLITDARLVSGEARVPTASKLTGGSDRLLPVIIYREIVRFNGRLFRTPHR